jgi:hypothetical protein
LSKATQLIRDKARKLALTKELEQKGKILRFSYSFLHFLSSTNSEVGDVG